MADVLVVVVLEVVDALEVELLVGVVVLVAEVLLPTSGNTSRNLRRLRLSGTNTCAMKRSVRVEGF
jgi:hypothetical protein